MHTLPHHAREIQEWLARLDIGLPYRGEGLPGMAYKVLVALIKQGRERVWLTGEEKHAILEETGYVCSLCGQTSNRLEWDHVQRLSTSFGEQELQPVCPPCHAHKTATEPHGWNTIPSLRISNDVSGKVTC